MRLPKLRESSHVGFGIPGLLLTACGLLFVLNACNATPPAATTTSNLAPTKGDDTEEDEPENGTESGGSRSKGNGGGNGTSSSSGLPCDVESILQKNCGKCHGASTQYGASANLLTWEGITKADPKGSGKKIADVVLQRIKGTPSIMPPPPADALAASDIETLSKWVTSGAARSGDSCGNTGPAPGAEAKLDCEADIKIRPGNPFVIQPDAPLDQYVCYGFDVTADQKRHITAMAPRTDNNNVIHHILLFESPTAYTTTPQECSYVTDPSWRLVTGWAPGGGVYNMPPEVGWPIEKGTTHYILQLHYNNGKKLPNQKDNTGYDFCSTKQLRANDMGLLAFGTSDLFKLNFSIPPRSTNYQLECTYTLPSNVPVMNIVSATPHMHKLGTSSSTYFLPNGTGDRKKVLDAPNFTFDSQVSYPASQVAHAGDVFKTRCGWTNPTDKAVTWGEGTGDEMCYNFVAYYPRIADIPGFFGIGGFNWATPSIEASCTPVK